MIKRWLFIGLLCSALGLPVAARAEIVVMGTSGTPGIAIGTILADDMTLEVPAGASVRIMAPSGRMQVITGPARTAVSELSADGEANRDLWNSVTTALEPQRTRGLLKPSGEAVASSPAKYTFAWNAVPVFKPGDVCVDGGAKLSLVRGVPAKPERIVVQEMQGDKRRAEATFADGKQATTWPADLEPRTGIYVFQAPGQASVKITLRLISPLPNPSDALRVLHGQRCEFQRNALLESLKDPAFQVSALQP